MSTSHLELQVPAAGVSGSILYYDEVAETVEELPLRGTVRVPLGAEVRLNLDCDGDGVGDVDLGFLDPLPADLVAELSLRSLTDDDLSRIGRFTGVSFLDLAGDFGDAAVGRMVQDLPKLFGLTLDSDRVTGEVLSQLPSSLVMLSVFSANLDVGTLSSLKELPELEDLGLGRGPLDGALGDAVVALRPTLRELQLEDAPAPAAPGVLEQLLSAGLVVNGLSSAPSTARAVAQVVAEGTARPVDPDEWDDVDAEADESDESDESDVVRPIVDEADLDALLAGGGAVLIDLTATWCGPCQMLKPILAEIAEERVADLSVVTVDVDDAPWLEARFGIQSFPTLVLYDGGEERARLLGAHPKRTIVSMLTATRSP